jgi:hypothetical protein
VGQLLLVRALERHHAGVQYVGELQDPPDGAVLAARVATLHHHQQGVQAGVAEQVGQLTQLLSQRLRLLDCLRLVQTAVFFGIETIELHLS